LLVYLRDIAYDAGGIRGVVRHLARLRVGAEERAAGLWNVARRTGSDWVDTPMMPADHN
jgi:hypothetical protein